MTSSFPFANIPQFLVHNIKRELLLGIEESLQAGAVRALGAAAGMHQGHRSSVLGQMRHFHMNESFAEALLAADAAPSPIKGNTIVVGQSGMVRLGRFNLKLGDWNCARKSSSRRVMARANQSIERLVLPQLFGASMPITEATAFFVGVFSAAMKVDPEKRVEVHIAVPDSQMKGWLFREPLALFLNRYDVIETQKDEAHPILRKQAKEVDQEE